MAATGFRVSAVALAAAAALALLPLPGDVPVLRPWDGGPPPSDIGGWIVFDSNRAGQFDIWRMRTDGRRAERLTDHPDWDIYPDWSPDGERIVFARVRPGDVLGQGEIWIMDADGGHPVLAARRGTFPQFTPDGRGIVFERDRRLVMRKDPAGGAEEQLFPVPGRKPFRHLMVKPRLSPDGRAIVFTTDWGGRWHVAAMDRDGGARLVAEGCEGAWGDGGRSIYFIAGGRWRETAVWSVPWPEGRAVEAVSLEGSHTHAYFPSPAADGRHLLFAACPPNQHDHFTSNYQIFIKTLGDGPAARVSRNGFDDRWPRLGPRAGE